MKIVFLLLAFAGLSFSQLGELPNRQLTPGAIASRSEAQVCVTGYSRAHRPVGSEWMAIKRAVYARYGIFRHRAGEAECDHLVPLSLGGSSSLQNLWPEPFDGEWNADVKDDLEYRLHYLVCDRHVISLEQAQQMIAGDWIATYKYVFHTERPLPSRHSSFR